MKTKSNLRWTVLSGVILTLAAITSLALFAPVVYEFPSCVPNSKVINVMRVPYGYQPFPTSKFIRDDQPIGWLERDLKVPGSFYRNGGLDRTYMYATYPTYQPLGFKSWRDYSTSEYESNDPNTMLFATVVFGRGIVLHPDNKSYIHDPRGTRSHGLQRIREDSIDGKYWVYPQPEQRAKFPYGKVDYKPNEFTYFMPKDLEFHTLIGCTDTGLNEFSSSGQCFITSDWRNDPDMACNIVEYRMAAKDMPRWREFDLHVKQQIQSLISQRTHGYSGQSTNKDK